jgi:hypothetical protein
MLCWPEKESWETELQMITVQALGSDRSRILLVARLAVCRQPSAESLFA